MTLDQVRRLSVLALALALVLGLVTHGVRAADMDVKMTMAAASDMAMPGKCDGCGSMSGAACVAACSGLVAMPVPDIVLSILPVVVCNQTVAPVVVGWAAPPDPYPPRPTIPS